MPGDAEIRESLEALYRAESGRILATLIRLLGDFDLAEDAVHDAFAAALERWPRDGVPQSPCAWLISTGRFKAIETESRDAAVEVAALSDIFCRRKGRKNSEESRKTGRFSGHSFFLPSCIP